MNSKALFTTLALSFCCFGALAAEDAGADASDAPGEQVDDAPVSAAAVDGAGNLCFFAGTPVGREYKVIRRVVAGKQTYGGVKEILPRLAVTAKKLGADAVINYSGSQRFGFFPWRMVRPVVRGVAVKWVEPVTQDCAALGGSTLNAILASDRAPSPAAPAASSSD